MKPNADTLIIQLVDAIVALGDVARQLKLALSNNDHADDKSGVIGWQRARDKRIP